MANRQTTWELKATDNLSSVIDRMQQILDLQVEQAKQATSNARDAQTQLSGITTGYNNIKTSVENLNQASKTQADEVKNIKDKFDALRTTVQPLTTIVNNVFNGAKAKDFVDDLVSVDKKLGDVTATFRDANTQTKTFAGQNLTAITKEINTYANDAKTGFEKIKAATSDAKDEDKRYQTQVENRAQIALNKIAAIQSKVQELADKQAGLADAERIDTQKLIDKKEELVKKIDKINDTYSNLGVRTEKEQDKWDNALKKTYKELEGVEGKIQAMPAKTAVENDKIEKQFLSLKNQVISASNALSKAGGDLENISFEAQKAEGYIGQLEAQIEELKQQRAFAQTESEVKLINTQLDKMETKLKDVTTGSKQMETGFGGMKTALAGALAYIGLQEIIDAAKAVFNLTATWEKYETALKVGLGSVDKANLALSILQSYADSSNFELNELADTFTKFTGRGIVLGRESLEKVGDVANALQKPFKELGEAILDVNNTGRWTELGLKAQTVGNKVAITYKGVTIEVEKTEQGALRAIEAFGTLSGVQGITAEQALTLGGRMSTLKDGLAGLGRQVGEVLTPIFSTFITASSSVVEWLTKQFTSASALTPVFSVLGTTINSLFGFIGELFTAFNEATGNVLPALFTAVTNNGNAMKLLATIMQVAVVGPFSVLVLGFKEIWEVSKLVYNGFQGVVSGLEGVGKAMVLDFTGAKASFNDASNYFTQAGQNYSNMKEMYTKTNADFTNSLKTIWEDAKTVAVSVEGVNQNLSSAQLKAVAAENDRWAKVSSGMKAGTAEYAKAFAEHLENLSKADGTYIEAAVSGEKTKGDKKKAQAFLSAQELDILVKGVQQQSLQDQLDLVDAKMKLEIEKINNHKVDYVKTEEDAALAIEAIIIKANREKERLVKESSVEIEAKELAHKNNIVELANKMVSDVQLSEVQRLMNTQLSADERAAIELDTQLKIAEIRKREQEIIEETVVIEKNARKQQLAAIINFTGNMMPELQKFADFSLAILDNYDLVSGKTEEFFKNQEIASKSAMDTTRSLYGENSVQFAQASENHAKSQKDLAEAQANASAATANVYMMLAQLAIEVMNSIADGISTSMDGIVDSLTATSEAFQNFTNVTVDINRQMIEIALDDTTKSFDDKKALIDDYIQYEKDTLYGNERLQNEINTAKNSVELAKWQAERQGQFVRNLTHGVPKGIIENLRLVLTWRREQTKKEEELARQQTIFEQNQAIQRAKQQIATYKAMADEKIRIAEETRDAEIAAQQATNEVIANELDVLDTKRKSLLDSWLERRLKDLEDDKNLALAQASTEEEKANIIIKYQGLMQAAHDEYKGAELDKTKSVKLATEELKAQEADFVKQKEGDTANTIRNINSQTTQMIRDANREIFEASKQITIAELQGEIAKLKAKRWFMNAGRVDSAIATIEGVISKIQGTQFGGGNIGGGAAVDGDLGVNEGYKAAGQKADEIASQAQKAMDATSKILSDALATTDWLSKLQSEAQGSLNSIQDAKNKASEAEKYALGTEYVEGFGYPDGVDTVPAFVNKGERIIPTELNNLLGGRSLSNEELVQRQLFADRILGEIRGGMQVKTFFQMPDIMLNTAGVRQADLNSLAQQIVDAVGNSGPNINITASPYGMNIEEIGRDRQHKKYYNNQYYSLN